MTITENKVIQVSGKTTEIMRALASLNFDPLLVVSPRGSVVVSIVVNPNNADKVVDYFRYKFGRQCVTIIPVFMIPIDTSRRNFVSSEVQKRAYTIFYANETTLFVEVDEE